MNETLVLNATNEPLARIPWSKAMVLFLKGKVEVVEEYENRVVRSATLEWAMPSVIRFLRYIGRRKRAIKFSRENLYARDKGKCQYCQVSVKREDITYDHVIPKSQGGMTKWSNIVISCFNCNQRKGSKTPEQSGMFPLKKPVKPKSLPNTYEKLFIWRTGMPMTWKEYLYDMAYWGGELAQD